MQKPFKVAGIGELLWDFLPEGKKLGGAPFNFAFHAHGAGCQSFVISAIKPDPLGEEIEKCFTEIGLDLGYVQQNLDYPTGIVTVGLGKSRNPEYSINENVAWDYIYWNNSLDLLAKKVDAVCFGTLAQRNRESRQTINQFITSTRTDCLRVFDINLRKNYFNHEIIVSSLENSSVLKLNDEELPVVAQLLEIKGNDDEIVEQLMQRFSLELIAYTKGEKGSILYTKKEKSIQCAPDVVIADTVGAGDAFTAILVTGLLRNMPINDIHKTAVQAASFVCTQKGATPEIPESILNF